VFNASADGQGSMVLADDEQGQILVRVMCEGPKGERDLSALITASHGRAASRH
jgi:hypothetical protein